MPACSTAPDPVPIEHLHEAADVVLVRVVQYEDVDVPDVERHVRPEPSERLLRVRAAVDEHRGTGAGVSTRIASPWPMVERGDVQPAIGATEEGDDGQEDGL